MAQTGYTPIQLYYSSTTTNVPLAANLAYGELAINITDGKLFYKDNANAIQVIGWKIVPATAGGTGQTSYAVGDLLYADTTTTLAKLPDVATGNALISGGVSTAPSWGKIGLTTHVSGVLPTANGGTNLSTFTANQVFYASSSSVMAQSANLVFDGTNLGVGTTPSYGFQVSKSSSGDFAARISNTSSGNPNGLLIDTPNKGAASLFGLRIENNSTTAFSVLTNGLTTIADNLVIGTSGKGIDFSATPGTGTSELLADYEEGTFTPTAGIALSSATGKYTKVGGAVHFEMEVTFPVTASTAGASLGGLPFTASANNYACAVWTNRGSAIFAYVVASSTDVNLYSVTTGGIYDYVDFSADSVKIAGTYFV